MSTRTRLARLVMLVIASLALYSVTSAQPPDPDAPARNPQALAGRFLGYTGEFAFPPPTPLYEVGDTEQFWIPERGAETPRQIEATLVGAAGGAYVWVEDGIDLNGAVDRDEEHTTEAMQQLATQYASAFLVLRLQSTFGGPSVPLSQDSPPLPEDLLPIPDVDNDDHVFVIYARSLPDERTAYYNPVDSIPAALVAGAMSNQRETILVNTTFFTDAEMDNAIYVGSVTRAFLEMVAEYNFPDQADWVQSALIELTLQSLQDADPPLADMVAFLDSPDTSLTKVAGFTDRPRVNGAQQLFLYYFFQRYGQAALRALFQTPGEGLTPFDTALAGEGIVDPVTDNPVTALDAFADFVITNVINAPFGDGRYVHTTIPFRQGVGARVTPLQGLGDVTINNRTVPQFGAYYLLLQNDGEADATLTLGFDGAATAPLLPLPSDYAPDDTFYWSGTAQNANPTMTRTIDLRAVNAATLTFDAWYSLPESVDYAYLSVSTDDGETWQIVPTTSATTDNPFGAAYGAGLTGYSNPDGPRPFPILGIVLGADGITVGSVSPGGPSDRAGIQEGDVIVGYDGQQWDRIPNIIAVLADYAPGDEIDLIVQRGAEDDAEQLTIPVTLEAHPTRTLPPDLLWVAQTADLTSFAGHEILLRFEVVTLPGYETLGFAVDNLDIAEVNFGDGGEQGDQWQMDGFTQTINEVPQPYIVQAFLGPNATDAPALQPLIGAGDAATSGEWRFGLARGQQMVVAVSGVSDQTGQDATFSITVDVEE